MHHINGGEIVKIETNEANINKLFGNDFWFVVPEYQRPYLWERDNVNDLLNDLLMLNYYTVLVIYYDIGCKYCYELS